MKYIRKSFFLFWLIAVMLFGTVSASAASAKPETPVLSGTAAGNRVTLNWNKVKKASGYQIFLYYKAYGKYKCVERIKNRDFPNPAIAGYKNVVAFPHLGASTAESEDNCAVISS